MRRCIPVSIVVALWLVVCTAASSAPAAPAAAAAPTLEAPSGTLPAAAGPTATAQDGGIDPALLAGLRARNIGPAAMSGRIAAIDAVADDPDTIYVGAATGGVWKSGDGGMTWKPIFDDERVHSVGALAVYQANPDIVWVGTGEGNPRNSVSVGYGVYRSIDGGDTWKHLGLESTERIRKVILHPADPDVAWVAALGQAWGENPERGIFRTRDGGETWDKVLYVDARTGGANLTMDPSNPNKLFAAMWQYRRWPWFFDSGGPGSGLYVSHDGGDSWKRYTVEDGMPQGVLGRMAVAVSASDPEIVYALVEAERSALLRSGDGGRSWQTVNSDTGIANRPFYYAEIAVDPQWPNRVYNLGGSVTVSNDSGKTFEQLMGFRSGVHPDHHAWWIHPEDPTYILDGNDGGVYISRDRGGSWRFVSNLPLAQFYHVAVDMASPYHVYGGLQDNGSWRGPAWTRGGGFFGAGIRDHDWTMVSFGDGFDTVPVPGESEVGYSMSQGGNLMRWDLRTGETRAIQPPAPEGEELRFNWNAGVAVDPFDPDTVYYGSQFVHLSEDRGDSWRIISPDLTTDNEEWQRQAESGGLTLDVTAAENFTTIIALAPSPVDTEVIWVGTDDGRLHVSRDDGETWTSLEDSVPDVPEHTWIPHIEPSRHDAGTAYVVFDNHRRSDWTPYVYRTRDFGDSWERLAGEGDVWGYALVVEEDPENPDLLFLGTEFGLYASLDGGSSWLEMEHGIPTTSVMDLVVHPREHDLVVGTHGRSIFILDDIAPLRELSAEVLEEPLHLFPVRAAEQAAGSQPRGALFGGNDVFRGENRPYGAIITYSLNVEEAREPDEEKASGEEASGGEASDEEAAEVDIEILDAAGQVVRGFEGPAERGVNRAVWDLRRDAFRRPAGEGGGFFSGGGSGPEVLPGTYTVVVEHGDHRAETTVEVLPDPQSTATVADREAKFEAIMEAGALRETVTDAVERILEVRSDVQTIARKARQMREGSTAAGAADDESGDPAAEQERAGEDDPLAAVQSAAQDIQRRLDELEKVFRTPPDTKGITAGEHVSAAVGDAMGRLTSSWNAPSPADLEFLATAERRVREAVAELNEFLQGDLAGFRTTVRDAGVVLLPEKGPVELPEDAG